MTLEEQIEKQRRVSIENNDLAAVVDEQSEEYRKCKSIVYESDQLREWLEELKAYRDLNSPSFSEGLEQGKIEMIDDIIHKCKKARDIYGYIATTYDDLITRLVNQKHDMIVKEKKHD